MRAGNVVVGCAPTLSCLLSECLQRWGHWVQVCLGSERKRKSRERQGTQGVAKPSPWWTADSAPRGQGGSPGKAGHRNPGVRSVGRGSHQGRRVLGREEHVRGEDQSVCLK